MLREFLFKQPDIVEAWGDTRPQDSEAEQDKEGGRCKEDTEEGDGTKEGKERPATAGGEDAGQVRAVCADNINGRVTVRRLRPEPGEPCRDSEPRVHRRLDPICCLIRTPEESHVERSEDSGALNLITGQCLRHVVIASTPSAHLYFQSAMGSCNQPSMLSALILHCTVQA